MNQCSKILLLFNVKNNRHIFEYAIFSPLSVSKKDRLNFNQQDWPDFLSLAAKTLFPFEYKSALHCSLRSMKLKILCCKF